MNNDIKNMNMFLHAIYIQKYLYIQIAFKVLNLAYTLSHRLSLQSSCTEISTKSKYPKKYYSVFAH